MLPNKKHNIKEILRRFEDIDFGTTNISEIILFKSTLTENAPVYEKLYSVKLA